jgi:glycosyltransferase involved in cell wall biosynthesis
MPGELLRGRGSIVVLIPAWQPEPCLVELVRELRAAGFERLLVVDDGSSAERQPIFAEAEHAGAEVLRHSVNLGKGRALKTGFNHVLLQCPEVAGVVTADADGQHTVTDIVRVADALLEHPGRTVLGVRSFGRGVPLRSQFGNVLTQHIFALVTGTRVADTQTGLRGLPLALLPGLMRLNGERYEYEMTMLAELCSNGKRPVEVPIATVYIENNRSSHFDPIRDSMRIYFVLARFYFSSIVAAAIDFLGFTLAFAATHHILFSIVVGRLSSLVNFTLNKRFVFHSRSPLAIALWRYYALAIGIAAISYGLIWLLSARAHWNVFAAKVVVDVLLSLVSFSVQRTFIFRRTEEVEPA